MNLWPGSILLTPTMYQVLEMPNVEYSVWNNLQWISLPARPLAPVCRYAAGTVGLWSPRLPQKWHLSRCRRIRALWRRKEQKVFASFYKSIDEMSCLSDIWPSDQSSSCPSESTSTGPSWPQCRSNQWSGFRQIPPPCKRDHCIAETNRLLDKIIGKNLKAPGQVRRLGARSRSLDFFCTIYFFKIRPIFFIINYSHRLWLFPACLQVPPQRTMVHKCWDREVKPLFGHCQIWKMVNISPLTRYGTPATGEPRICSCQTPSCTLGRCLKKKALQIYHSISCFLGQKSWLQMNKLRKPQLWFFNKHNF